MFQPKVVGTAARMRVLLIEDDSATAQSIELMLKSESFNVYTTDLQGRARITQWCCTALDVYKRQVLGWSQRFGGQNGFGIVFVVHAFAFCQNTSALGKGILVLPYVFDYEALLLLVPNEIGLQVILRCPLLGDN